MTIDWKAAAMAVSVIILIVGFFTGLTLLPASILLPFFGVVSAVLTFGLLYLSFSHYNTMQKVHDEIVDAAQEIVDELKEEK